MEEIDEHYANLPPEADEPYSSSDDTKQGPPLCCRPMTGRAKKIHRLFNFKRRWIIALPGACQSIAMLLKKKAALYIIVVKSPGSSLSLTDMRILLPPEAHVNGSGCSSRVFRSLDCLCDRSSPFLARADIPRHIPAADPALLKPEANIAILR